MLTKRMMVQAVADRMAGIETKFDLFQFDEPWLSCYKALESAQHGKETQTLLNVLNARRDKDLVIERILAAVPGDGNGNGNGTFRSLAEIAPELPPITWLWPGWIPKGMLSLLGAVPGAGKSFLALELIRRIISGEAWPDGSPNRADCGRPCIYVDAELVPQLILERARNWNIDMTKLYLMMPHKRGMIDLCQEEWQDQLIEMCHAINPAMVVIDSLGSAQSKGENAVEDVRAFLGFLSALAGDSFMSVMLIHHLRKKQGFQLSFSCGVEIDDFRGSGHIIAMSRVVMGLSVVRTEQVYNPNGPRRLEVVKTNLSRYPDPLGMEFEPRHPTGVNLRWVDSPDEYHEPTQIDAAKEFILDALGDGPMKPEEIVDLAKAASGISRATIYRAHSLLKLEGKISYTDNSGNPQNKWKLGAE